MRTMYKSNIEYIISLTNRNEPIPGVLSLICDTVDSMKTDVTNLDVEDEQRKIFKSAIKDLVSGLIKLDGFIANLKETVH